MVDFEKFLSLLKEINKEHYIMMEYHEGVWCYYSCDNSVSWNTEGSIDDLEYGEGCTYGGEVWGGYTDIGQYRLMNVDNGCGEKITMIFNLNEEINFE